MSNLSKLTSQIVAARDSKRSSFIQMRDSLAEMSSTIEFINSLTNNRLWSDIIDSNKLNGIWIDILDKSGKLRKVLCPFISDDGTFALAFQRANRDYVNIGAVGITREGKSKYIDQTTELGEWLLPRRDDQEPCTTAPVNVINGSSKELDGYPSKSKFVRVTHFTISEFINLLRSYIVELGGTPDMIPSDISTRENLLNWLSSNKDKINRELSANLADSYLSKKNSFIEGYFAHAGDYVKYLVEDTKKEVSWTDYTIEEVNAGKEKAKAYYSSVCYYEYPNAPLQSKTYRSYATKKADIYTEFKVAKEEVKGIQFLDTPGIGEQKIGLERSLSENVAMNLDVILVVKSVRDEKNSQETNRNTLITLLRRKLNGKSHGKDSIYFLLNMWPDVSYQNGLDELSKLKSVLEDEHSVNKIVLDDSQYRMINVKANYEVLSDNRTDRDNPLGKYLYHILNSLIPNIRNIDSEYFSAAELEYSKIMDEYEALLQMVRKLSHLLPSSDISDRVDKLLKILHDGLDEIIEGDNAIDGGISYTIKKFCDQPTGIVFSKFLGVNNAKGVSNIDAFNQVKEFCEAHKSALLTRYKKFAYKGYMDFQSYALMKIELCNAIEDEIYNCIDTKRADNDLREIKRKLAQVFIQKGKLGFVNKDASSWWLSMANYLQQENALPALVDIFSSIATFSIDYRKALEGKLDEIMLVCKHKDNFGNPAFYNFQTYDNALIAITHSLLHIEEAVQGETEENVVKKTIEALVSTFDVKLSDLIRSVSLPDPAMKTSTRSAMEKFYKKHANEIFTDDEETQKLALISSWNSLLK